MNPTSTSIFARASSFLRGHIVLLGVNLIAPCVVILFSGSAEVAFAPAPFPYAAPAADSLKGTVPPADSKAVSDGAHPASAKKDTALSSSVSPEVHNTSIADSSVVVSSSEDAASDSVAFRQNVTDIFFKGITIIPEGGKFLIDSAESYADSLTNKNSLLLKEENQENPFVFKIGVRDTTWYRLPKKTRDSIARADSIRRVPRDSTARIAQFLYHRTDEPMVSIFEQRTYSMFGKPPSLIIRTVELDSTGQYVIVRERVNGGDVKIPEKMPLDEYVRLRYAYDIERSIADEVHKVGTLKKKNDLGDVLGSITNIDIPIPANPVFSIFGPPKINLHISGAVDIHAGFTNTTTDQVTLSALGNTVNQPDFSQQVQINVSGTIGDKLNILADWNTQRTFEYENQLKIKYTGYDDEIVQSVEAGNVSLATNSSFISSSSALFGIKSTFQFGPLKIIGLASQKKGQIQEKNISGGSSETDFTLHAYNYNTDHYFVDTSYISQFESYFANRQGHPGTTIIDQEVWITSPNPNDPTAFAGLAFINLPATLPTDQSIYDVYRQDTVTVQGQTEAGKWQKLVPSRDFTINQGAGYITMNRSVQDNQAIAIAYRVQNPSGHQFDAVYGTFTGTAQPSSVLILKLIKPRSLQPVYTQAWRLLMKNIYALGGRDIKSAGFQLNIYYNVPGQSPIDNINGTKLLQLFGFDNYKSDNSPGSDNVFDYIPPWTVDETRGEIIFQSVEPFLGTRPDTSGGRPLYGGLKEAFDKYKINISPDSFSYPDVYDNTPYLATQNNLRDRFTIVGKTTAGSSNTINLGFNIVENSVQVLLNCQPLAVNVDYTVDYITGQVIIKNQAALVPGANLQVKFEQNDLFQIASKTLLGTRAELKLSDKTGLGFTLMNLNQQTLSEKVRLGEEPTNNTIYGFDGQTGGNLDFLTKAIDALPFVSTKAKSEFTLRGEMAFMSPDANTQKSTIGIDQGKSIAYVDDFEGAKKTIPFGVSYGTWHYLSPPGYIEGVDTDLTRVVSDGEKMFSKAKTYWYTIPNNVAVTSIWPYKSVAQADQYTSVFYVDYNPRDRGEYNYSMNLDSTLLRNPERNWGGMQRLLASGVVDLVQENINYIEIWVKIDNKVPLDTASNRIFIDLGALNEDVIPDDPGTTLGGIHTEDNPTVPTGVVSAAEDVGLDRLSDDGERSQYAAFIAANKSSFPNLNDDPSGDDYVAPSTTNGSGDYSHIDGTENNLQSENGRTPDTDDLNHNNYLDKTNSYFEYQLNLDTSRTASGAYANPQLVGGGSNGWYEYRIPLINWTNKIGSPDFSLVEYARMWFTGFKQEIRLGIAQFDLVGNQWKELVQHDSTFSLAVVNIEDNPAEYISPPGVSRARDLTKPDEQVFENEQALALNIHNLTPGSTRQAIKQFNTKPLDMFSYRELKMFVRGDPSFRASVTNPSAKLFLRLGADSLNYYEYKEPIMPADRSITTPRAGQEANVWSPQNNIDIVFSELAAIKQGRDSAQINRVVSKYAHPGSGDSATYSVLGNPTLTNIQFISIGIENPDTILAPRSTIDSATVWVNELRLVDVDNSKGRAYSVSGSVKLADIGSVSFSYTDIDPNFHQLESQFGSRTTTRNWGINSSFALDRFLPPTWTGTSLPFSFSHTEGSTSPKYLPGSDVDVASAAQREYELTGLRAAQQKLIFESQTLTTSSTYAMPTFKIVIPSERWYIRDFFDKLVYGFSYNNSLTRSPTVEYQTQWGWTSHLGYAYTTDPNDFITPLSGFGSAFLLSGLKDFRLYYPIQNINLTYDMARSQVHQLTRGASEESPPNRNFSANRTFSFAWKLTENGLINLSGTYSLSVASTMVSLETDTLGNQRPFTSILRSLFFQDQLIGFGHDISYGQNIDVQTHPRIMELLSLNKYVTMTAHYSVGYHWQNSLQLNDLGKGAGWANSISLSSEVSLKQFVETWFPTQKGGTETQGGSTVNRSRLAGRGRGHQDDEELKDLNNPPAPQQSDTAKVGNQSASRDSTKSRDSTLAVQETKGKSAFSAKENLLEFARILIKTPFLDYDKINVSFDQSNSATNGGIPGRPGFANLFGRPLFFIDSKSEYGPTAAYQLGFVSDPTANITGVHGQGAFPYFGFSTNTGLRAPNGQLNDSYTEDNKISLRTTRDLWTGAHVDLTWNVDWKYSRNETITTDSLGRIYQVSTATTGSVERSFFTLPPVFVLSAFKSGITEVSKEFAALEDNTSDTRINDEKLSQAFENGFESVPLFRKLLGEFMPRFNYSFHWDGLEQLSIFKSYASHVSLDHAYSSTYQTSFHGNLSGGDEIVDAQHIGYQFSPLLGLSVTFKELFKGNVSANIRYNTTESYDLIPSAQNIVENGTKEISITGSFGRTGFEIPFFGLSLSNDIDISLNYTYSDNSRVTYTALPAGTGSGLDGGVPGDGSSRSVTEPRIRYVLSSRVTASLFYRYTKVTPDAGGSTIPGSTTNEGGLDVHISIQ
ncbi:MAG TPA: cell surface protein SprA [Bacteroidota bacterium]|nr:cell surface protein SprA [Bacteroidota bacterium]